MGLIGKGTCPTTSSLGPFPRSCSRLHLPVELCPCLAILCAIMSISPLGQGGQTSLPSPFVPPRIVQFTSEPVVQPAIVTRHQPHALLGSVAKVPARAPQHSLAAVCALRDTLGVPFALLAYPVRQDLLSMPPGPKRRAANTALSPVRMAISL